LLELFGPGGEAAWLGSFPFAAPLRPRLYEVDALGHVSNVAYPAYLEFGRMQLFAAIGDPEPGPFPFVHLTAELHVRYLVRCFYDEPLEVRAKIAALGRSSATVEEAVVGAGESLRAIAQVTIVRLDGEGTAPWTTAQRAAIAAFAERTPTDR
jgi:acyl-CoA thioester hydrolase